MACRCRLKLGYRSCHRPGEDRIGGRAVNPPSFGADRQCHWPPIWYHRSAKAAMLPPATTVQTSHAMSQRIEPTDTTAAAPASEPENTASETAGSGHGQPISLNDFIKTSGLVGTGGQAKLLIQGGDVVVNGEVETRRRRKLWPGDTVSLLGQTAVVPAGGEPR